MTMYLHQTPQYNRYEGWNFKSGNITVEAKRDGITYSHFYHMLVYV